MSAAAELHPPRSGVPRRYGRGGGAPCSPRSTRWTRTRVPDWGSPRPAAGSGACACACGRGCASCGGGSGGCRRGTSRPTLWPRCGAPSAACPPRPRRRSSSRSSSSPRGSRCRRTWPRRWPTRTSSRGSARAPWPQPRSRRTRAASTSARGPRTTTAAAKRARPVRR